jgi:hypothetical protein
MDKHSSASIQLLVQFLETYLGVSYQGVQSGFGVCDDLILFAGGRDSHGAATTLAVPASILLLPQEQARQICQEKIRASTRAFEKVSAA